MGSSSTDYENFVSKLSSEAPTPGGGGASALVGALGAALGCMALNIMLKRNDETKLQEIKSEIQNLQMSLLELVEADAAVFEPLYDAYKLPNLTEEQKQYKTHIMEAALVCACKVPLKIMQKCCEVIDLHQRLHPIVSQLLQSDIGVGVIFCKSALCGAALNVFCNTRLMKNRVCAHETDQNVEKLLKDYSYKADELFCKIKNDLVEG